MLTAGTLKQSEEALEMAARSKRKSNKALLQSSSENILFPTFVLFLHVQERKRERNARTSSLIFVGTFEFKPFSLSTLSNSCPCSPYTNSFS